ncbi:MAG: phosphotransferase family protein [Gammaproteobacteria bacterium]
MQFYGRLDPMSEVVEVQPKHQFDQQRVAEYLQAHLASFAGPLTVHQFSFGQSNPTYLLETPSARYVMRRKPPGKLLPSAHAVDREYRVIKAVSEQGFPVPRPLIFCEDDSVAGTIFYVMEYKEGRVFSTRNLDEVPLPDRGPMVDDFIQVMGRLHAMDYRAMGLADFGRPGNYFQRQINRWSKQYRASETDNIPEMERLIDWLPNNIPTDDAESLVHGDYSLHNVMFHPQKPQISAVLDWELSTVGHPLGDLFYALMPWYSPSESYAGLSQAELQAQGMPSLPEIMDRYAEISGRAAIENQAFYQAYTLFRLAGILQGIVGRVRDGTASNPNAALVAAQVQPLARAGCDLLDRSL